MPFRISEPGFYHLSAADYFSDPCPDPSLTQSIAKILINQSPLHAWTEHPRLGGRMKDADETYTSALAIGNAAHKLLLERGKEIVAIDADSFRTKDARTARDKVSAEGNVPILAKHYGRALAMVAVAKEQLAKLGLSEFSGDSEIVLAWREDGTWLRSMIDRLSTSRTLVLDYKTTGMSCAPHGIGRMMVDAGWDTQAAMHERGLNALHPKSAGRRRHLFVAQENVEPYALTVCEMSEATMTIGRKKLMMAMEIWRTCTARGVWPGYPSEIIKPEYPGYMESQWLEREMTEFASVAPNGREQVPSDILMGG